MENPRCIRLEYSTSLVTYKGEHLETVPLQSDANWEITKYTYDGSDIVMIQVGKGTWTGRASLVW